MSYMVNASRVAAVLGVKARTLRDLSHAVEKGLPKQALSRTAKRVFVERGSARKFLVAPPQHFQIGSKFLGIRKNVRFEGIENLETNSQQANRARAIGMRCESLRRFVRDDLFENAKVSTVFENPDD